MNPVNAMGNAMQDASVVFDPEQTNAARLAAARDMGMEMTMTLAPAALVRMGYLAAPAGLAETFALPVGVDQLATDALSDVKYAARSVRDGDMQGLIDVLTPSGQPQSLSAAGIGDNGGPPLDAVPARASMFSPSLRAAENLKQNKGTYEQMRGMLLKGGGKETELEWSGMDRAFAGKKVTKDDLINYLRKNDPSLQVMTKQAFGKIGANNIRDFDEWFNDTILSDQPLMSQEVSHYADFLADDLYYQDNITAGHSIDLDQLEDFADRTGLNEQEIADANYIIDYGGNDVRLFNDSYDAVMDYYGEDQVEQMAMDSLREHFEYDYNQDPEDFTRRQGGTSTEVFDERETRYSEYIPEGAENYRENTFKYRDPTGQFDDDLVAGASHFGGDDPNTQYHTRVGDYQTTNTVGGKPFKARYVAEIQSDAQQNMNPASAMTYDEGVDQTEWRKVEREFDDRANALYKNYDQKDTELRNALTDLRSDSYTTIVSGTNLFDLASKIKSYNRRVDNHNADLIIHGTETAYNPVYQREVGRLEKIDVDLSQLDEDQLKDLYYSHSLDNATALDVDMLAVVDDEAMRRVAGISDEAVKEIKKLQRMKDSVWMARSRNKADYQERLGEYTDAFIEKYDRHPMNVTKSGPMMASQNRWVDDAIRRSIIDAVNDDSVDFLAFPKDEQAIGKVGGTSDPKDGTIDFYNRDVQNRLRGIYGK